MRIVDRPLVRFLLLGAIAFAASRLPLDRGDDALLAEAYRLGLDRRDPVVRRRLVANLRFAGADPHASDDDLLHEAFALEMQRSDVVVRRRLVQAMELRFAPRSGGPRKTLERPATWRLRHVLLRSDRDASELRARLAARAQGPAIGVRESKPFLLGNHYGPASRAQIAATFGNDMADEIAKLEPGRWSQPIGSAWGSHLVWVEAVTR